MIKKISALIIIVSIFVILLSCSEDATSPKTPDIEITNPKAGFVWGDTVEIQVRVSNTENLEMIKLFIDNDIDSTIIFEDYIYPFNFNWNTEGQRYGKYYIQARLYKTDGTSTKSEIITVTLSPCPVYEEDLQNFQGITETDSIGNLIGNIDSTDWYFEIDTLCLKKFNAKEDSVELSSFTATVYNKLVVLEWTTLTETNNQGFNVYRGTTNDLNSANKINLAMIQGQGTSSEPHSYSFEDDTVENGNTYYYWLEQVDFDGESHFSWSIEATPEAPPPPPPPPPLSFGPAHPNPNNGACSIPFALPAQSKISIIIIDKNGNLIDVICDGTLSAGYHNIIWNAPENINKLYRCIFHQSDSLHWHGDILVE